MAFTLVPSAFADNGSSTQKLELKRNLPASTVNKIDEKLLEQFKQDEYVSYLVRLKEQTDTTTVANKALSKALANKSTASSAKLAVRTSVVSALRETATRTQDSITSYLEQQSQSGEVKQFKGYFIVNALYVTSTKAVLDELALQPEVEKIVPNETRYLDRVDTATHSPSTAVAEKSSAQTIEKPVISKENAKDEVGVALKDKQNSNIGWNIAQVNAPEAWAQGIDGTGIVVANLDSGVDYTHPALTHKWRGRDASGNIVNPELSWYDPHSGSTLPADGDGHGTHTMGTMVGSEPDGTNYIGVAPGAKWIAVRIFNPSTTDAIILDGGQWILAPVDKDGNLHPELAPDVVNNSWGGGPGVDDWFRPIVRAWRDAGIFPEFSAGNVTLTNPGGPGSVANPANYPESFATGATDINQNLAGFSLRGPSAYDGILKPEVSAPGVNIRSSVPGGAYESAGWDGTSMAGPHTTALAGLLLQANHSLTVSELEEIIKSTATPRTDAEYPTTPNNGYGHGIINVYDAVSSVLSGVGTVSGKVTIGGDDEQEPVITHTPPEQLYKGFDVKLTAEVSDDVAVTSVEFYAKTKGTSHYLYLPATRVSGDSKNGKYEATVPAFLIDTAGLEYYVRVNDYGNNIVDSQVYTIPVSAGITPGYIQNFEDNNTGYVSGGTNNTWAWGTPVSGPGKAYSGDKVLATNLTGTYPASANSHVQLPPIDLSDSPNGALLSFKQWYDLENNVDFGKIFIATEDSDHAFVEIAKVTGLSNGWKTQYIDLTPYGGQQVHVLLNLTSDTSVQKAGWYIDDVKLSAPDSEAPAAPAQLQGSTNFAGNVALNWQASQEEDFKEYKVYRSTSAGTGYELLATTAATSYTDATTEDETTYHYVVTAVDYSGNESAYSNEVSLTIHRPTAIYSDDFDGSTDNGWTHSGAKDEWERGIPTATGGPASAVSLPNVWATDLDSTYENSADASLYSPAIDLTGVSNATLTFEHWFEIETNYDFGYVEISSNAGDTWSELGKFSHSTAGKSWTPVYYNLDSYVGKTVQVRFRLKSDSSVSKLGWYLDNFKVLSVTANEVTKNVVGTTQKAKDISLFDGPEFKLSYTSKEDYNNSVKQFAETTNNAPTSLPANATVTVLETGRSVKTDPSTGRFSFNHAAGDFTLKAEAYGYSPKTLPVTITDGTNVKANFKLDEIPSGTVHGTITDERSGLPIEGATIIVNEDATVAPIQTGADGTFSVKLLEGTYTLAVSARDYYNETINVTVAGNDNVEANATLKPFIGFPGEIKYDDGTPENARAFNAAGNAWAVRFTPESDSTQVTGVSLRFWNTEWPSPGGTAFQYAVYDATGIDGAPGRQVAGPFDATALRNNQWTVLELPQPVNVTGDFYVVYIQTQAGTASPGLATDESSPNALRSWQRANGTWSLSPAEEGNYMIRATVRYPLGAPEITSPANSSFTNTKEVTISGTTPANGAEVKIFSGTELLGTGSVENNAFQVPVQLNEGLNELTAEVVVNGKTTDRSAPATVTVDTISPTVEITSPAENDSTNSELVHVVGTVADTNLDRAEVNGQAVTVDENGSFRERVILQEGENVITVSAVDKAGNTTTVTRTIHVNLTAPEISNLTPAEDIHIKGGESFTVAFDSAPGLQATFRVELPLLFQLEGNNRITLIETSPGHYEGSYQTPTSLRLDGGIIVVQVSDTAGNKVELEAAGKLYVTSGDITTPPVTDNQAPVAVIDAKDNAKKSKNVKFNAKKSYDPDGQIVSYSWQFGDGSEAQGVKAEHVYKDPGTFTVQLTVTDDKGATNTVHHQITIK